MEYSVVTLYVISCLTSTINSLSSPIWIRTHEISTSGSAAKSTRGSVDIIVRGVCDALNKKGGILEIFTNQKSSVSTPSRRAIFRALDKAKIDKLGYERRTISM
jgi:hypothetical protein